MPVLLTTNKKSYFVQLCVEGKRYYLGAYGSKFKAEVIEREGLPQNKKRHEPQTKELNSHAKKNVNHEPTKRNTR